MDLHVTEQQMNKARRHIERREATAEIALLIGIPVRHVRRAASTMTTERIRRWLAFEQRTQKRISKSVQGSIPDRLSVAVN